MTVKPRITIGVKLLKEGDKGTHSIDTLCFEGAPNLIDDSVWWLAAECEHGIYIRIVARATKGHLTCKLFEIKFSTFLGVVFIEESR